jgi:hypothetical protein
MSPWFPRIDEVRSSGWSNAERQAPETDPEDQNLNIEGESK